MSETIDSESSTKLSVIHKSVSSNNRQEAGYSHRKMGISPFWLAQPLSPEPGLQALRELTQTAAEITCGMLVLRWEEESLTSDLLVQVLQVSTSGPE